jgi:hypothetical protein
MIRKVISSATLKSIVLGTRLSLSAIYSGIGTVNRNKRI